MKERDVLNLLIDMKRICILLFLFCYSRTWAQSAKIDIPDFGDRYSELVQTLEDGLLDIDYVEFRESFIQSEQFFVASAKSEVLTQLRKDMREAMRMKKFIDVVKATKGILSIDYTDMQAHKILQQTYKILGDSVASGKYHDIEFGLLRSITGSGDGKTCETGWHVVQIEEEYFVLNMLGAQLNSQSLVSGSPPCDKMEVTTDDGDRILYFEIGKVLEGEKKMMQPR